jgi:excisionase family DNA binding protein
VTRIADDVVRPRLYIVGDGRMDVNATGENHAMAEGKLLLRPTEAASALGVSRARLYQLLASGEINSVKIGASRRVPAVELRGSAAS